MHVFFILQSVNLARPQRMEPSVTVVSRMERVSMMRHMIFGLLLCDFYHHLMSSLFMCSQKVPRGLP